MTDQILALLDKNPEIFGARTLGIGKNSSLLEILEHDSFNHVLDLLRGVNFYHGLSATAEDYAHEENTKILKELEKELARSQWVVDPHLAAQRLIDECLRLIQHENSAAVHRIMQS